MGRIITLYKIDKWCYENLGKMKDYDDDFYLVTIGECDDRGIYPIKIHMRESVFQKIQSKEYSIRKDKYSEQKIIVINKNGQLIDYKTGGLKKRENFFIDIEELIKIVLNPRIKSYTDAFSIITEILGEIGYGEKEVNVFCSLPQNKPKILLFSVVKDNIKYEAKLLVLKESVEIKIYNNQNEEVFNKLFELIEKN